MDSSLNRTAPLGRRLYPKSAGARSRQLVEVEARIADLQVIPATLRPALEAGCDDLAVCVDSPCCPLPFADLAREAADVAH